MVLSSDEFVFRPPVAITETNFPLENPDRVEPTCGEDSVLSYGFTDPLVKHYIKFPSVSKIIEETISDKTRQVLAGWRQKMVEDLGEDGFFNHSEALKARGQEFHLAVRNAVLGRTTEGITETTQNSLKSLSWMLEHISNPTAVESTIAHPTLGYRGVADCIAMFRNIPVIIDWKLSDKPKRDLKDTYDAPVQITAYIGALNHDPNYKWGVNHGLVAVAYANGDPCDVFLLAPKHCQIYWRHWLMRFDKFKASDVGKNWMNRRPRRNSYYGAESGRKSYGQYNRQRNDNVGWKTSTRTRSSGQRFYANEMGVNKEKERGVGREKYQGSRQYQAPKHYNTELNRYSKSKLHAPINNEQKDSNVAGG